MPFGSVKYIGSAHWQQVNNPSPQVSSKEGLIIDVVYSGRADEKEEFSQRQKIGQACVYIGADGKEVRVPTCFLTQKIPDDGNSAWPKLTLRYEGFSRESGKDAPEDEYSESTVTRTVTLQAEFSPPVPWTGGRLVTSASRTIVYETQEARIVTYHTSKPTAAGGATPSEKNIRIVSSSITLNYSLGGQESSTTTRGMVPPGVLAKLTPKEKLQDSGFTAEQVTGTKWWRASTARAREYVEPGT